MAVAFDVLETKSINGRDTNMTIRGGLFAQWDTHLTQESLLL